MWIVQLALNRPYTFIVLALLILILSPVMILRTPTDIFPNINIPVVAVAWTYTGLSPEETEGRITTLYERALTTLVDNIEHLESTTVNGTAIIKIYLQPTASIDRANAQVTAVSQTILRQLPPGSLPPLIVNYNASTVPIVQLGLSGQGLTEPQLNDIALNFLRTQLVTVPGAAIPFPFGGKQRQVMVYLNQHLLQAKGLSPNDVLTAIGKQNLILPGGTAKMGHFEYDVDLNADLKTVQEFNDLPIKTIGGTVVFLRDVATVGDGFAPQTNVVRQNGDRGALLTVLKAGDASTIDVVQGIRALLPRVVQTLPPELKIQALADQSVFVRGAISGVIWEAMLAAALTGFMILLFLGSWRSTLIIAISIPLSILTSVIILSILHETINIMTLGGLALAVGILVDDATVTIENVERHLEEGAALHDGILDGAAQIATPALVSTLCICIVFLPMFFLSGVARFLFAPLAEAVIFAMLASYILSRTLVPTLAMYLLKAHNRHGNPSSPSLFARLQKGFERLFEKLRSSYATLLSGLVAARAFFVPVFLVICLMSFILIPFLGQDFFPDTDSGQMILHVRATTGTRIEDTARLADLVEGSIRQTIPVAEMDNILDNIGLPYSNINYIYNRSGLTGAADADVMVSLKEKHRRTADYVHALRERLPREYPGVTFYFLPADIVTQTLSFGLPAPIDIQIDGADINGNRRVADKMMNELSHVHGIADLRVQQQDDYPKFHIDADRTKAAQGGLTESDIASNVLISLSGSFQVQPMFYLNPKNGVSYNLVTQMPQYDIQSGQDLRNIPISGPNQIKPAILADVASIQRTSEFASINHYNIRRVVDIYGAVQDRDLGAVGRDVDRIIEANRKLLPRGSFLTLRGQYGTMRTSYIGLLGGLGFAIIMVYLLIVVNFQSWLDPFIIITALPAALAGIVLFLFLTHTTLSVPALMGAIMCMGVATANSILVVSFAKERLLHHGNSITAAVEAGSIRFRPVIMTALAMIIGMIPMALGLGDGGEQNAPLGRAVIGGLLCATVATLVFVPAVFALLHGWTTPPDAQRFQLRITDLFTPDRDVCEWRHNMDAAENNTTEVTPTDTKRSEQMPPKPSSRWPLVGAAVAVLVVGTVIYSGIHQRVQAETTLGVNTERAAVPTVNVVQPLSGDVSQEIVLPGNTQAFSDTPIYARTNGYLKRWYVDIGAHVTQGQLLAEIETPEVDQQLEQARADLKNAQANEHLAQITADRWQNLLKTNAVSKQETDQAVGDLSARQASVESTTANVNRLEQLQSFEKVYAPFAGVITARNTDVGALINAGAAGVPQELFHMAAVNRLRVYVAVPEVDSQAAQTGTKATLTLDEFPGETFQGTIVRNSDSIDAASRTLNVEIDVANPQGRIKTGAYVFVHLNNPQSRKAAGHSLTIPADTLLFRSEGLRVGVVRNGRAELVPITIGRDFGATVEVVAGLHPNDEVIVNPSDSLTSGSPVQASASRTGDSK